MLIPPAKGYRDFAIQWVNKPPSGRLRGLLFLDGSAVFSRYDATRRAGWAVVMTDQFGNLISAAYGLVPLEVARLQFARDGEDFAALQCSQLVDPSERFSLFIDCAGTVTCFRKPAFATSCKHNRAHMWGPAHAAYEGLDFTVEKVKAHASEADVDAGLISHWQRRGNWHADRLAKRGAALHELDEDKFYLLRGLEVLAHEAGDWAATSVAHFIDAGHASEVDFDEALNTGSEGSPAGDLSDGIEEADNSSVLNFDSDQASAGDGGGTALLEPSTSRTRVADREVLGGGPEMAAPWEGSTVRNPVQIGEAADEHEDFIDLGEAPSFIPANQGASAAMAPGDASDTLDVIGPRGVLRGSNLLRRAEGKVVASASVDTSNFTFNGHDLRVLDVEGSSEPLYTCRKCWKYSQERWRDLKLPCSVSSDAEVTLHASASKRCGERILAGKHPDGASSLAVFNFRHLSELQRRFAAIKMGCTPQRVTSLQRGGNLLLPHGATTSPAHLVPTGPFLVRAPEFIRTSSASTSRDAAILGVYGIRSSEEMRATAEVGRRRNERPHGDAESSDASQDGI